MDNPLYITFLFYFLSISKKKWKFCCFIYINNANVNLPNLTTLLTCLHTENTHTHTLRAQTQRHTVNCTVYAEKLSKFLLCVSLLRRSTSYLDSHSIYLTFKSLAIMHFSDGSSCGVRSCSDFIPTFPFSFYLMIPSHISHNIPASAQL